MALFFHVPGSKRTSEDDRQQEDSLTGERPAFALLTKCYSRTENHSSIIHEKTEEESCYGIYDAYSPYKRNKMVKMVSNAELGVLLISFLMKTYYPTGISKGLIIFSLGFRL